MHARTRRTHLLGALAAALTIAAVAAPAAQALELGLQDDGAFLYRQIGSSTQALDLATQLKTDHIRSLIFWNRVAGAQATQKRVPKTYHYDFRQLDALAAAAAQRGIPLQLVLTGKSPAYATANHRVGNFKPSPKLYAAWVKAVATRYKGRGFRYSLWNEPNFIGWLQPLKSAPQLYRPLVTAGYRAIKQADPSAHVLVGELASYSNAKRSIAPLTFLRRMRCAGCGEAARRRLRVPPLRPDPRTVGRTAEPCAGDARDAPAALPRARQGWRLPARPAGLPHRVGLRDERASRHQPGTAGRVHDAGVPDRGALAPRPRARAVWPLRPPGDVVRHRDRLALRYTAPGLRGAPEQALTGAGADSTVGSAPWPGTCGSD